MLMAETEFPDAMPSVGWVCDPALVAAVDNVEKARGRVRHT